MPLHLRKAFKALFELGEETHVPLEPPRLKDLNLFDSKISLTGIRDFMSDKHLPSLPSGDAVTPTTPRHNGNPLTPSRAPQINGASPVSPAPHLNGNTPAIMSSSPTYDTLTKHPTDARIASPPPFEAEAFNSSQLLSSQPGTPTSESGNVPWSAAVGRASLGKSGRVIDRLMGDNDRLRRDKTLATAKLEEEVKKSESARSTFDALQAANDNLQSMHDIDKAALTRKDRKIEEMKAELDAERSRREKAETEAKITRREREDEVEKYKKEAMKGQEESRYATTQYDVLSKSWKSMEQTYQRQTQKLRADMKEMHDSITKDQQKLSQLGLISDQLRQEADKAKKAKDKIFGDFEAYKEEQSKSLSAIKERAERNDTTNDQLAREMETVLGQMRYVVNVKKDVKEAE